MESEAAATSTAEWLISKFHSESPAPTPPTRIPKDQKAFQTVTIRGNELTIYCLTSRYLFCLILLASVVTKINK